MSGQNRTENQKDSAPQYTESMGTENLFKSISPYDIPTDYGQAPEYSSGQMQQPTMQPQYQQAYQPQGVASMPPSTPYSQPQQQLQQHQPQQTMNSLPPSSPYALQTQPPSPSAFGQQFQNMPNQTQLASLPPTAATPQPSGGSLPPMQGAGVAALAQQANLNTSPLDKPMSKPERLLRQRELIVKYAKDMLTPKEAEDVRYWNGMENTLYMSYLLLWIPLSFAFYAQYKKKPIENGHLKFRIITIHLVQVPLLWYASNGRIKTLREMERKYMNDLSDYEILNFEPLFRQLRAQQQPAMVNQTGNPLLNQVAQTPPQHKQQ